MTTGGDAEAPGLLVLEPEPPRIVDGVWRREAEGSALVWDADARLLTYRPPTRQPDAGWSLAFDGATSPSLVHVTAELPYGSSGFAVVQEVVDVYAVVDDDGRPLVPPVASGVREFFAGWYGPAAMRSLAEAIGVVWREDRPSTWHDLNTRYPGLLPHGHAYAGTARASLVAFAAMAVLWLAMGLGSAVVGVVSGPRALVAFAVVALGLTAFFVRTATVLRRAVGRPRR